MYAALPAHISILIMLHVLASLLEAEVILILVTQTIIPQTEVVKYLGINFDFMLKKKHIDLKTKEITG